MTNIKMKIVHRMKNTVFIVFFIVGFITMLQLKSDKDNNLFFNRESLRELELQLLLEDNEIERLDEYLERRTRELEELNSSESNQNVFELLSRQRRYSKALNGLTGFRGQGVMIQIQDSDFEILPSQNPNDFVVHDQDILNILNDLKIAESEAISINNQVLMSDSTIKCSGATITINGKTYGQPFVIRAIGNPKQLEAAIRSKDSYSFMISSLYGIRIKVEAQENIEIPSYRANKKNQYLREVEQ